LETALSPYFFGGAAVDAGEHSLVLARRITSNTGEFIFPGLSL
jgi:hypothetical protein